MKKEIIDKILKLSPHAAYFYEEYDSSALNKNFVSIFDKCRPFAYYVNNNSKYLGIDGGPSPCDIWDYKFSWNKKELNNASIEDLQNIYNKLSEYEATWKRIMDKYANMDLWELIATF